MSLLREIKRNVLRGQYANFDSLFVKDFTTDSLDVENFKLTNGPVNGYVLTSDEFGNGNWAPSAGAIAQEIIVSGNPGSGQFSTIASALASITDASPTKLYVVRLGPGIYDEFNLTVPSYVTVRGSGEAASIVKAPSGANPVFIMQSHSSLLRLQIDGNVNQAVGVDLSTEDPNEVTIQFVLFTDVTTGIQCGPTAGTNTHTLTFISYTNASGTGVYVDGSGAGNLSVVIRGFCFVVGASGPPKGIHVVGPNGELILSDAVLSGVGTGTAMEVSGGGKLEAQNILIEDWAMGINVPNDAQTPTVRLDAVNFSGLTTDLNVANPNCIGNLFSGSNDLNKISILDAAPFFISNFNNRIVCVGKKGANFTTLVDAVAYVSTQGPSSTDPWTIVIGPGTFTEVNPVTIPSWIQLQGQSFINTIIQPTDTTQPVIIGSPGVQMLELTISGATTSAAFQINGTLTPVFATVLERVRFDDSEILISQQNTNGAASLTLIDCIFSYSSNNRYGLKVTQVNALATHVLDVRIHGLSAIIVTPTVPNPFTLIDTNGFSGAPQITMNATDIQFSRSIQVASQAIGFALENTQLNSSASLIQFCAVALQIKPSTQVTDLSITGMAFSWNTLDMSVESNAATGNIQGILDASKIDESAAPNSTIQYVIQTEGEGLDITGSLYIGDRLNTRTNLSPGITGDVAIGLYTGGALSTLANTIRVEAGTGYVTQGTDVDPLIYVTWDNQLTAAIGINEAKFVSVVAGPPVALQLTDALPNEFNSILIGKVVRGAVNINYIQQIKKQGLRITTKFDDTLRDAFGSIVSSGLITSSTGTFVIDVTSGRYYYSALEFTPSGGSGVTYIPYFHSGGVWTTNPPTTDLGATEANKYDDGTNLVALNPGEYAKHVVYVVNDGSDETYLFVYGQQIFASQNLAENGVLPNPPPFFDSNICSVASFVVTNGGAVWISIQDVRPTLQFTPSGVTVTTDHGSLSGLLADDHPQYLLVNGTRAMSGQLDLGSNNVVNTGTIDGVNITNLAPRLQPGGADPLSASTPAVTISTSNAVGTSTDLARADHVHAHGSQTDPTLHAVVTGVANGFMIAADKTKLDGATALSTASTLMLRNGSGATAVKALVVEDAGVLELSNTANTQTVSMSAPPGLATGYSLVWPSNDGDANQFLQTNGSGTLTWAAPVIAGASVVQVRSTFAGDLNTGTPTTITWALTDILDGGAYTILGGNQQIQVTSNGRYEIYVNMVFTAAINRANLIVRIRKNGVDLPGSGRCGYIRNNNNHNSSSISLMTIQDLVATDTISITTQQEANGGVVNAISGESVFNIKSL